MEKGPSDGEMISDGDLYYVCNAELKCVMIWTLTERCGDTARKSVSLTLCTTLSKTRKSSGKVLLCGVMHTVLTGYT